MTDAAWLRAEMDRLDRNQAEIQKWSAEQQKLMAKEFARSLKPNRDPWFIILGALFAAIAGAMVRLPEILDAFGIRH